MAAGHRRKRTPVCWEDAPKGWGPPWPSRPRHPHSWGAPAVPSPCLHCHSPEGSSFPPGPCRRKKEQSEEAPIGRTGPSRQEGPKIISCQGNGNPKGTPHLGPRKAWAGLDLPGTFVEFDGEADNLVVTQGPLLLLKDLTTVFVGAIGDCGRETELEHCSWGHVEWKLPHRNTWTHPDTDIQTDRHRHRDILRDTVLQTQAEIHTDTLRHTDTDVQPHGTWMGDSPPTHTIIPSPSITPTFCQRVGCIEVPPPFHLICKSEAG